MNLKDKVIVITGGGQGLGRSMAVALATKGAKLALVDLNQEKLDETVTLCKQAGGDGKAYLANIAKEDEVIGLFDQVIADFKTVDGLVNNAGITRDGLLVKGKNGEVVKRMSLQEWQSVIDVNLTGVFLCGREAATRFIEHNVQGLILNISSLSKSGNLGQTNYTAAKAGVAGMTVTWAKELGRYGIRCAGIAPGFIATDMVAAMKPEVLEKLSAQVPLNRLGTPEEIAQTAVYIFENDYYNGRTLEMDGGIRI